MKYLLDTDICIELIRGRAAELLQRLTSLEPGEAAISAISVAELQYGVTRSSQPDRNRQALELFLLPLDILDFDFAAAARYGDVRAQLEAAGRPIGSYDMLIAAHALSHDLTLVTRNVREFERVAGLHIETWK